MVLSSVYLFLFVQQLLLSYCFWFVVTLVHAVVPVVAVAVLVAVIGSSVCVSILLDPVSVSAFPFVVLKIFEVVTICSVYVTFIPSFVLIVVAVVACDIPINPLHTKSVPSLSPSPLLSLAYLEAVTSGKVCIRAEPEFGGLEGHLLIIYKVLYDLWLSQKLFGQLLQKCLRELGLEPSLAESTIYVRKCPTVDHYEYTATYADN